MALKNILLRSLKTRVTLFTLAIFLLSIWSLEFYANQMLREGMQRTMGQQQFSSVSILAEQVNQELEERLSALEKIAASIAPALLNNPSALQDTLEQHLIPQELFNLGIYVTDIDAVAIADVPLSMGRTGISYADRDYMVGALKQGKATISRPVLGKKSHAPVIVIGVPIRDSQGHVIGALAGVTNLGQHNFLDHITGNHYGKTGYFLIEEPRSRLVITASDKSRIMQPLPAPGINRLIDRFLQGHEETGITVNPDGVEVLASSKRIPVANWLIIAALPIAEAFAPIHDMQQRMLLATLLLTLLAGGLTWWMLRRQLSPMLTTVNTLAALSETNQPPQTLPVTSRDEIGQLIGSFNHLLETLAQREAALRESEHKLSVILESVDAYIYLKDTQGRYLFANRPVRELFGVSMEELVGYGDDQFFDAATVAQLRNNDRQVLREGKTIKTEETNLNLRDGRTSIYLSVKLPLCNDAGEVYALCGISTDITDRKRAEEALASKSALLEAQLNATIDGVLVVDQDRKKILHNHRLNELFDIPEHLQSIEDDASQLEYVVGITKYPDEFLKKVMYLYAHPSESSTDEVELKNGKILERFSAPIIGKNGQNYGRIWTFHDVTARKQAEEKLHLAASVFSHSREGIMITATDGAILDVNDAFSRITGYSRDEAVGHNPRILNSGRQCKDYYTAMWQSLIDKGHWYGEVWNRRKSGEVYAEMQTISTVYDDHGAPQCYVALFSDITSQKEHQRQLEHIAHYDALTCLPNRLLLADRLHQGMVQVLRRQQLLAVVFLDLDGFKAVNDNYGHEIGDQLLIALANRIKQALREGDTLARIGGDEFVAVLLDLSDTTSSIPLLSRMLEAAAQPFHVGAQTVRVSASLGITFFPQEEVVDADQLLRQADQAMYQAKLAGKNRYHVFDAEQDRSVRGQHESQERIRRALADREFVLHYQPKVNMRSGKVIGVEALVRWQHPERGLLPPAEFLPTIQDHPLEVELDAWVIDTALGQLERWQAAGLDLPVSINVSARQLMLCDFVDDLRDRLISHPGIKPGRVELEVQETSALEDLGKVAQVIAACRELGVSLALDDFGTGYCSLAYLKHLPVARLKIDLRFVTSMLDEPDDMAILKGVIGLASAFRRGVIAEGVESVEHGRLLLQLGCEEGQGFGIASPMPAAEIPAWTEAWRPDPAWAGLKPVDPEDVPMLFARTEHRAWIKALECYLQGAQEIPSLDCEQCCFGMWLNDIGRSRYGMRPVFRMIEQVHEQVHDLAIELCNLHAQGHEREARARLGELHELRDSLLGLLTSLEQQDLEQIVS